MSLNHVSIVLAATLFILAISFDSFQYVHASERAKTMSEQETHSIYHARRAAAQRKRRIIVNNDGDDVTAFLDKATPEAMLKVRTARLLNTQVDTIVYNTGYCFGNVLHRTKVGTTFTCKKGGFANNKVGDFVKQGTDGLQIVTDFCRKNNIEIFWSMRMNDIHDGQTSDTAKYMFPPFKKNHPELLMGSKENKPKIPYWTSVDYSHQQVRDMAFKLIEEVCENYDIDGVDLDFFRHMPFFKSTAMGGSAGQEDWDKMTSLLRRIRQMADKVGIKRGRPILISVRVPDSVGYCKAQGFDIVRWMEEDLIDMLAVTGYFRLNPWEVSVELGHKYGIPVYPCLSDVRQSDKEAAAIRSTIECLRGRAAVAWNSGADGIYMFNCWNINNSIWNEIGEQRTLATVNKVYTTGARSHRPVNRFLVRGDRFINTSTLSPEKPRKLIPGKPIKVKLYVAENVREAKRQGAKSNFSLFCRLSKQTNIQDISVKLNDKLMTGGSKSVAWIKDLIPSAKRAPPNTWIEYTVNPDFLKQGLNLVIVESRPETGNELTLEDMAFWARYYHSDIQSF